MLKNDTDQWGRRLPASQRTLWNYRFFPSKLSYTGQTFLNLMFVDPCIIVQFIKKNPTRCNNVSKFYYTLFILSSICFGWHTAHHQEPKTALAASGFSYVEVCWTCSWWTLSGTVPSTYKKPDAASAVLGSWW